MLEEHGERRSLRLGFNVDHVATLRNARGGDNPDPLRAARIAVESGVVDGITAHLREDRRHVSDEDIARLGTDIPLPLNLEMAPTREMRRIALRHGPEAVCLVPERREERTTEGGLDAAQQVAFLRDFIAPMDEAGCRVSLFIEPDVAQIEAAKAVGAPVVELHTGAYANAAGAGQSRALSALARAAHHADSIGLEVHAGHGLTYENVTAVAALRGIIALNIGHFLVGEALFRGLKPTLRHMRTLMDVACTSGIRASGPYR